MKVLKPINNNVVSCVDAAGREVVAMGRGLGYGVKPGAEMLAAIAAMEKKYGLRCANVFHAGDGNLHPLIMYDASVPGEWDKAEAFGAEILELSVALGGSITGEHGVGIEKINQMCVQYATPELAAFHRVKAAFDEAGLLNPGKAIPSLHRCAEYGRMHVHRGELKFPEMERF